MQLYVAGCAGFGTVTDMLRGAPNLNVDDASSAPLVKVYEVSGGLAGHVRDLTPAAELGPIRYVAIDSKGYLYLARRVATDSQESQYLANRPLLVVYEPQASGNDGPFQTMGPTMASPWGSAPWLATISGLAVDRQDSLYALFFSSEHLRSIVVFPQPQGIPAVTNNPKIIWIGGFDDMNGPGGSACIAIDNGGPNDRLYTSMFGILQSTEPSIVRYDLPSTGPASLPFASVSPTRFPPLSTRPSLGSSSGLIAPTNMAFDSSGNMYVANGDNVLFFSGDPNAPLTISGFSNATAVAVDDQGYVYVVDYATDGLSAAIKSFTLSTNGQPPTIVNTGITGINPCGGLAIGPDYDPPSPLWRSLKAISLLVSDIADDGLLRGPGGGILPGPHGPGGPLLDVLVGISAYRLAGLSSSREAVALQRAAMALTASASQKELERLQTLVREVEDKVR